MFWDKQKILTKLESALDKESADDLRKVIEELKDIFCLFFAMDLTNELKKEMQEKKEKN